MTSYLTKFENGSKKGFKNDAIFDTLGSELSPVYAFKLGECLKGMWWHCTDRRTKITYVIIIHPLTQWENGNVLLGQRGRHCQMYFSGEKKATLRDREGSVRALHSILCSATHGLGEGITQLLNFPCHALVHISCCFDWLTHVDDSGVYNYYNYYYSTNSCLWWTDEEWKLKVKQKSNLLCRESTNDFTA